MIRYLSGIANDNVLVTYDHGFKTVTVQNVRTNQYGCFAEFPDMEDLYLLFEENISEETDYHTALRFFQPNIAEV